MPMLLSRFLVLILLLTVLAPGFGWQAAGGMPAEVAAVDMQHEHAADGHDAHAMHEMPCDDCGTHAAGDDCADTLHHCCPGYILGHLAVQHIAPMPVLSPGTASLLERGDREFASRVPAGLERPPRHFSA